MSWLLEENKLSNVRLIRIRYICVVFQITSLTCGEFYNRIYHLLKLILYAHEKKYKKY